MEIEVIEPDYYYHIFNRGINRQPIFISEGHYYKFLALCNKYIPEFADILAYCLIPNHFHLLLYIHPDGVPPPRRGVNSPLCNLFNAYAQWFNKGTDRTGSLFQRPFKRKKILSQEYLKQVIYYIHRNPMHHNIATNPADYIFSSYRALLNNHPTFLNREHVLEWFDGPSHFADYHKMRFDTDSSEYFDET
jgi:REP element-mobilizing transposase RayT